GSSPWYLRLLRDDTAVPWRMAKLLASGRYATDLLLRAPAAVARLGGGGLLAPADPVGLRAEADAPVPGRVRTAGVDGAVAGLRAVGRRALPRAAAADLPAELDCLQVAEPVGTVTAVTVQGALALARDCVERSSGPLPAAVCVVAMGRFGGHEMG